MYSWLAPEAVAITTQPVIAASWIANEPTPLEPPVEVSYL